MKQIEHDKNEFKKMPDYGERAFAKEKFGDNPRPSDLLSYFWPFFCMAVALFLWRSHISIFDLF